MSEKILLIDGHSILNRAFYGLPDLTNAEGRHTGAVYGFLNIMFRIMEEEKPEYLTVAFDLSAPTFRHKRYEAYKGTRKPMPEELREQVPLIKEMLAAMGINIMSLEGYEADDLLGTVARRSEAKGMDVTILSGDRDLLQLATDKVLIRLPKTVRGKTTIENYHTAEVLEKYQVTPPQIIELKALMGDSSDNIPGIPGVGEKTATKMIVQFGSIENAHEHLEEVKPNKAKESLREHYDMAQLSKELATINTDSPLEFSYEKAKVENPYTPEAYELCKRLEFKNMLNRFDPVTAADSSMELEFFTCNDLSGVEALFEKAARKEQVGISVLADPDQVYAVGLVLDEKEIYQIPVGGLLTGDYLCGKLKALADSTVLCAMDIKAVLKHVPLEEPEKVFDTGVAAYLLNPLKSSYTYDDIAREYLDGMMLPAKEDLLGKTSLKKAWEEEMECLGNYACYQAFVPCMARGVLLEKLGLPGGKKTKTGYSTAADILDKLAADHAIVKDILEYRQLTKLKSTYADGLGNVIGKDGRIHSTFNQTITATGRISSTDPNLQNIPVRMELGRLIRKVFVPEEGFVFLDADYSQIELRVLAHMSGDEKLIQAYREAEDIHRLTASQVFHVPLDEVTPLQRRNAKAVNFGIVYGISSFGLSQDLSITRKEAAAYIEKYFETYPKIKGFLDGLVKEGREHGYVTTMFGRRRPVPELKSSNFMQRSFGERVAMNSPIQGTAADIIKIAMNHVYERMKKDGLHSRLVLQVHDELLIETKKEEIEIVSRILEEEMKGAADLAVELEVDMHQGDSWYEAK